MPQRWKLENLLHAPAARYDHAAAWDGAQRKLWVHGGWDGLDGFRDLWSFDVLQHRWSLVPMSIGAPTQRWSHVAAWDGTFLWLHGGWSSTGSLRELWKFDPLLTLWSLLSDAGPAARHDHVATYDEIDHSLLVHGGWDGDQVFGDLWKFQERLRRWSRVSESVEARPTARFDHAAAYDAQRRTWWLHGGGNGVEGFTDLWALDVPTLQWTQVARGSGPSTWDHVCAWDPVGRALWIHGGWGSDDLWKFDVEANHWSIQERGGSPRWDHVAALDTHGPNGPMLYIHGGRDSNNRPYPGLVEFQLQPTMDCLMPGQLLSMGGSWTCPVAAITFISVLVLMAFAMCTASCTDWRLRSQRLHGGDGARTKAASLGCLGRCVNELLRHVQAIQLRVLPGDLQTASWHPSRPSSRRMAEGIERPELAPQVQRAHRQLPAEGLLHFSLAMDDPVPVHSSLGESLLFEF
ncbi:Mei4-dependent protein 6 [Durusdinium trenchii]|uniref:Mei4-dependent protein 6 n=1 Tax=Durusdinium trenchii TaxID=1381693 RepID=A0ABP0IDD5_9DINO